jgi:hypothetical protein
LCHPPALSALLTFEVGGVRRPCKRNQQQACTKQQDSKRRSESHNEQSAAETCPASVHRAVNPTPHCLYCCCSSLSTPNSPSPLLPQTALHVLQLTLWRLHTHTHYSCMNPHLKPQSPPTDPSQHP